MIYLDRFLLFLDSLPDSLIYFLLGLSAFVENVFPPAPGDTITAFGAFLAGADRLHFLGIFISTTLGSLAGFMFLFWIGELLGKRFFIGRDFWYFKTKDIIRAEEWFRKYGYLLILLNRFFPGIRSVISIASGILKLRAVKVTTLALISCSLWNMIWMAMGYTLGRSWKETREKIDGIMSSYDSAILILMGIVILFLIVRKLKKRS